MVKQTLFLLIFLLCSSLFPSSVLAKKKQLETYSATEAVQMDEQKKTPPLNFFSPQQAQFDRVPPAQKKSILNRLVLIEKLIRDQGRAYDYRVHTTQELIKILSSFQNPPLPNLPKK
jgi:hypothetical protein